MNDKLIEQMHQIWEGYGCRALLNIHITRVKPGEDIFATFIYDEWNEMDILWLEVGPRNSIKWEESYRSLMTTQLSGRTRESMLRWLETGLHSFAIQDRKDCDIYLLKFQKDIDGDLDCHYIEIDFEDESDGRELDLG
jgi:hypothetical protein